MSATPERLGGAADAWRDALGGWVIPDEIMDAASESPYGWPIELWKRRTEVAAERSEDQVTVEVVQRLMGGAGVVADIGPGTGRTALPLARAGHRVVAVEKDKGMAKALADLAIDLVAGSVDVMVGPFPEVRPEHRVDVALSANVVYDVADIGPFIGGMHELARHWVVIEMTDLHPWTEMGEYFRYMHGLDRPNGPGVDELIAVVGEVTGVAPEVERWSRPPGLYFETWDEVLGYYGKRLAVPIDRRHELTPVLEPHLDERGGRWWAQEMREFATIWWPTS